MKVYFCFDDTDVGMHEKDSYFKLNFNTPFMVDFKSYDCSEPNKELNVKVTWEGKVMN